MANENTGVNSNDVLWANGQEQECRVVLRQKTPNEARFTLPGVAMTGEQLVALARGVQGTINIKGRKGDSNKVVGGNKWTNSADVDSAVVADAIESALGLAPKPSPVPPGNRGEIVAGAMAGQS